MGKQVLTNIRFESGHGSVIRDDTGRTLIDLHNNGSLSCGHRHEILRESVAGEEPLNIGRYRSGPRSEMTRIIRDLLPGYDAYQLYSCGTQACEGLLRYASAITGRNGIVGFRGAYHGNTRALASATDVDSWHGARMPDFLALDYPTGHDDASIKDTCDVIASALDSFGADRLAGMIAEPISSKSMQAPPAGFWKALQDRVLRPRGILLLADEYMTSGRIGHWLGFEADGASPDAICIGKAMKTGMPFALLAAHARHAEAVRAVKGEDSASGQPHICRNVTLTLAALEDDGGLDRLAGLFDVFHQEMMPMCNHPAVERIGGAGALWGVTLHDRELARAVGELCLQRGVLLAAIRNCLRMTPAFDITEDTARAALGIVRDCIRTAVLPIEKGAAN
ncbi:MAG: aminotransferase class III-fold pyridoxal phosphate-dependent enzyme [Paracoccaceae bacterium]